jgi:hypothetical protein
MSDKKFFGILIAEIVAGIAITAAHAAYIYYAYTNSSIIYFISKELWL